MSNFRIGDKVEWLGTSGASTGDGAYNLHKQYEICYVDEGDNTFKVVDEYGYSLWVNGEDFKLVTAVEPSKPSNEIFLTLTQDEAQALADILACVGGCPELSRRKFTDNIKYKLNSIDVHYNVCGGAPDVTGTTHCRTIFDAPVRETVEYNGSTYDKAEFDMLLNTLERL